MNKKVLTMAVMAAVCGMAAAPVWAANSGGTVNGDGKFVGDNGAADNRLLIDEDSRQEIISGLGTGNDKVQNNSIEVSNGTISEKIIGGMSEGDGDIDSNSITISGGKMRDAVYGAYTEGSGAVTNNKVIIGGMAETSRDPVAGALSQGSGTVAYNSVTATGGNIYSIFGGGSAEGIAEYNSVTVEGDTIIEDSVGGAAALEGVARHNSVTISGTAEIKGKVFGGKIETSSSGDLIDNSVMISGGSIRGEVYGAYTEGDGAVTNNSVTISGRPIFAADSVIYGGYSASGGEVSGNILNIKSTDITVSNIKNFDVYNFYLPDTVQAGDVLLTVTGGSSNEQTDLKGSSVNVGITGSAPALKSGDNVTLLHNANGILADGTTVYGKMTQGVSLEYDFTTVLQNGDSLVTTIIKSGISDDTKSLVETQAAAAGFINSGADLLVSSGITSMSKVTSTEDNAIFGAMSGGSMRYDTGSHADVKGYNFALGMGKAVANNAGRLTFGPFVEYGYGDYTSYLDNGVRGDGKTKYYGVGVLARQDDKSGVYYEGSLRYGRMDADYASNDLGTAGVHSSYDSSSAYYGAHLGIGKVTGLNDTTKADVYAKLLYTHQNGDSVTLQGEGNGEVYDFDAVDSTRARVGARVSKAYSERGTGYVGLAYEYEFDGEARATVKGFSTPAPSIKGSSGLVELGYILQPQGVNDPTINIGLQGWGGKKQGFTGNVDFVWTF